MTDETKLSRGAGGRPKPPSPPYLAPDTLHSRSFATVQDLISEGEIEGFASASKEELSKGTTAYDNASLKMYFLMTLQYCNQVLQVLILLMQSLTFKM